LRVHKGTTLQDLASLIAASAGSEDDLVCLVSDDLRIDRPDWLWEAVGLFERYPDTGMIGGHIRNSAGATLAAGYVLGFGGAYACPDRGRPALDPGYFKQMWKQRSVSAVSAQFAVLRARFLCAVAAQSPGSASLSLLGAWASAWAQKNGRRVIYSPYLSGVSNFDLDALVSDWESAEFMRINRDLLPDCRFYPAALSSEPGQAYQLVIK
jgi:hypothetical protein